MEVLKVKEGIQKNIIQNLNNSMKQLFALISLGLILTSFNFFPYSYLCFKYPINGCTDSDFWWKLPTDWINYNGINWLGYLFQNFVVILVVTKVYNKLTKTK